MAGLNTKCDVLVTYCWNRVGYNILRSLAAKGLKVYAADTSKRNICSMSKFCAGSFVYPDPFSQEEDFISCLLENINHLKPKVLMPTHDEGIVIAKHIERFPKWLLISIESFDKLSMLSNKASATELAAKVGVPVPKVYTENDVITDFPVVLKTVIGNSAKGVYFPSNSTELENLKNQYSSDEILVEEKIGGCDYSVDCIRWKGFFKAAVYRAVVTKTDGGGTTTQRVIVEEPALIEYAKKMLDHVDYNGVCGLDYRYDPENKICTFIEVNARFTGGLATEVTAGFDLPYMLYCLTVDGVCAIPSVKVGTKTKWLLGDVITLVGRLVSRNIRKNELKQVLKISGFDAFDDFRKDDKFAILGEMVYYFEKLVKNRKLNP